MCKIGTLLVLVLFVEASWQSDLLRNRNAHRPKTFNLRQIKHLANLSDRTHMEDALDNILIPRVVGTANHNKVHNYIVSELRDLGWDVKVQEFEERTPNFGKLTFRNIIATLNPNADRFLVLAAHYDSKYFKNVEFLAATDSAVPCAMMLNLAKVMSNELKSIKDNDDLSLQLIFFDGEEAFVNWSPTDSIYGARNLAKTLENTKTKTKSGEAISELDRIDVLVLLDLIGHSQASFSNFFSDTEQWYKRLVQAERKLAKNGLMTSGNSYTPHFKAKTTRSHVEDDHIPFLQKGVPILHLISVPFPRAWHTPDDNRQNLDMTSVDNINKVLRIFVAEYMHVSIGDDLEPDDHTEL